MKIETKYSVGDTVFYSEYNQIKEGKIVDVVISANKSGTNVIYEVNDAPSWYDKFSFGWLKHSKQRHQGELYTSISEIGNEIINDYQLEIDIRNEKIRKIKEQISKQQDSGK